MSTTCTPALAASLEWCQGTPEYPGIKRRVYYIPASDIVQWPTLPTNQAGQYTSAEYTGNFTLAQGKKWHYIDVLPDKCQLTSESQGEVPSVTQLNTLTLVHPAVGAEAAAAAFYFANTPCVFIVEDMKGNRRVVGNDRWNTVTTIAQDLGQGATGTTSTTITAAVTDVAPAPFYSGELETEDAAAE